MVWVVETASVVTEAGESIVVESVSVDIVPWLLGVVIGLIVGFIVIALFMPLVKLLNDLS